MAAMGNSILGHKQSGHKQSGHKQSGHKQSGHKQSGHKQSGHKQSRDNSSEDTGAQTDYLPFEPHPHLLTADPKHADPKHADPEHADHKPAAGGSKYGWVAAAVASAVAYGGLSFFQYVITRRDRKLNMMSLALCVALVESVIGLGIYAAAGTEALRGVERGPFKNYRQDIRRLAGTKYLPYTASTALCDGAGLAALLKSYTLAGNPGFSDVISDTYSMVQAILTYVVYGKKMDVVQIGSLAVAVAGAALISLK